MRPSGHRRQVLLFLVAIILPCLVLVALSLRMISQEQELAEKRLAEEQRHLAIQIRQELLARLEGIKLQEVSALATQADRAQVADYKNSAVVLVGWVEKNRFVLPWEVNRDAEKFRRLLHEAQFARKIQQGEHEELAERKLGKAAELYREAIDTARHPAQAAYARLLLARVLTKAGQGREADNHYRKILTLPSEVVDEHGVPLSLYAAARLLEAGGGYKAVLERMRAAVGKQSWRPPAEVYMLRGLAETLLKTAPDVTVRETAKDVQQEILEQIRYLEQALALQSDFPKLMLRQAGAGQSQNPEPLWIPYGEETWLVSVSPPLPGLQPVVVAVRAEEIFTSLDAVGVLPDSLPGDLRFHTASESKGEKACCPSSGRGISSLELFGPRPLPSSAVQGGAPPRGSGN